MHSVVVVGDFRSHRITAVDSAGKPIPGLQRLITGGAAMLSDVISQALSETSVDVRENKVLSYSKTKRDESCGIELSEWNLREYGNDENIRLRLHSLVSKNTIRGSKVPSLSAEFLWALSSNVDDKWYKLIPKSHQRRLTELTKNGGRKLGHFESTSQDLHNTYPDIVVIDDLGLGFRTLNEVKRDASYWSYTFKMCEELVKRLEGALPKRTPAGTPQLDKLEPIIIWSIVGELPRLNHKDEQQKLNPLLKSIISNDRLKSRTIILLDANDLRLNEHFGISSGLSWERTVQDTLFELHRHPHTKELLQFGHVIVRYGVTGALHIFQSECCQQEVLYFHTRHDDMFNAPSDHGRVLGESAVFIGSMILEFDKYCTSQGGTNLQLHDLNKALGVEAIPQAIMKCKNYFEAGYGRKGKHTEAIVKIEQGSYLPDDLFEPVIRQHIGHVSVLPVRLSDWSILAQSAQGEIGAVARRVVKRGVEHALNAILPYEDAFIYVVNSFLVDFYDSITSAIVYKTEVPSTDVDEVYSDFVNQICKIAVSGNSVLDRSARNYFQENDKIIKLVKKVIKKVIDAARTKSKEINIAALSNYLTEIEDEVAKLTIEIKDEYVTMKAKNSTGVVAPICSIKDMRIVDRREIEGIKSIQLLIHKHIHEVVKARPDARKTRPLSIAVFGPPGSGKTYAVESIVKDLIDKGYRDLIRVLEPYNLAQYSNVSDLEKAFDDISKSTSDGKVPVAFFDEFDSALGERDRGWLKCFLAPMETSTFLDKRVHNAIFVFAGGTATRFDEFSPANRLPTDPEVQKFARAKGPDFVSRLKCYINVVGVNPAGDEDQMYLLRRAVIVRGVIESLQSIGPGEEALIDEPMLRAILAVPQYRDGARSLRSLLHICADRQNRNRISSSSMPLLQQLDMLTDGKAFIFLRENVAAQISRDAT